MVRKIKIRISFLKKKYYICNTFKIEAVMFTIRLDPELKAKLYALSKEKGISQSAVVKEALAVYLTKETASATPFELGEDLFGQVSGGLPEASKSYKKALKEKLHGKHSH